MAAASSGGPGGGRGGGGELVAVEGDVGAAAAGAGLWADEPSLQHTAKYVRVYEAAAAAGAPGSCLDSYLQESALALLQFRSPASYQYFARDLMGALDPWELHEGLLGPLGIQRPLPPGTRYHLLGAQAPDVPRFEALEHICADVVSAESIGRSGRETTGEAAVMAARESPDRL